MRSEIRKRLGMQRGGRQLPAREQGEIDGYYNRPRPSVECTTAADLREWWAGWKAGRKLRSSSGCAEEFVKRVIEVGRRSEGRRSERDRQPWQARRREYLRNKGRA